MFCSECGTELPSHAKFCRSCGSKQQEKQAAESPFLTSGGPAPQHLAVSQAQLETDNDVVQVPDSKISTQGLLTIVSTSVLLLAIMVGLAYPLFTTEPSNDVSANPVSDSGGVPVESQALKDFFESKDGIGTATSSDKTSSVWFAHKFENKNTPHLSFFIKSVQIDPASQKPEGCRACGADISVVTYMQKDNKWELKSIQKNFTQHGVWGDTGEVRIPLHRILAGPDVETIMLDGGASQGGFTEEGKVLIGFTKSGWRNLGYILTSESESGSCTDTEEENTNDIEECWAYTGKISTSKGNNPDFYDLIVTRTGTRGLDENNEPIPVNQTSIFVFDGKEFVEKSSN